jgi:hypothetical protein
VVENALAAGALAIASLAAVQLAAREMCCLPATHPSVIVRLLVLEQLLLAAGLEELSATVAIARRKLAAITFGDGIDDKTYTE